MDFYAVDKASERHLKELGLQKQGDIVALQGFVREQITSGEREDKKRKLLSLFTGKATKKVKKTDENSEAQRNIEFGWLHFDLKRRRYVSVRTAKGGGTRKVTASLDSNVDELIPVGSRLFFPDGKSMFGSVEKMIQCIGNFRQEQISGNITLRNYVSVNSLSKVRLYFMTKPIQNDACITTGPFAIDSDDDDDDDDDGDLLPVQDGNLEVESDPISYSQLIGSSVERDSIKADQDTEYEKSLAADRAKAQELKEVEDTKKRRLQIQATRKARLYPEPAEGEACAVISVRHPTLGIQKRSFKVEDSLSAAYEWVGSLSDEPEKFSLSGQRQPHLSPSLPVSIVDRSILNMTETETMVCYPDHDLNFRGFGEGKNIMHVDDTLPLNFMEEDDNINM